MPSAVALIPARQGRSAFPGKNVRPLGGHPLIAYTIAPALESGVFEAVIVSTDSEEIAAIARHYGAEVPFLRPAAFAGDTSPDIEWLEHTLRELQRGGTRLGLLQPAAPDQPVPHRGHDPPRLDARSRRRRASIRCARSRSARSIPARCGWSRGERMLPLLPFGLTAGAERRSRGTARRTRRCRRSTCRTRRSRSPGRASSSSGGRSPATCWCRSHRRLRRFDINDPYDWMVAERLIADGAVALAARLDTAILMRTVNGLTWVIYRPTRAKRSSCSSSRSTSSAACSTRTARDGRAGATRSPRWRASTRST